MGMVVQRFDVFWVCLDPTVGREMQKTRPCVIISPDEMNHYLSTVIVAPMTTRSRAYPTRIACHFQGKEGEIVLDQIRVVDKARLMRRVGQIDPQEQTGVLDILGEMFAE